MRFLFINPNRSIAKNNIWLARLWREHVLLPRECRRERVDLLHCPKSAIPFHAPCPTVVTLHDLIPLAQPGTTGNPGTARVGTYTAGKITAQAEAKQNALLVLGDKYYRGWRAFMDGKEVTIYPVNHVLRGIYLPPGNHTIEYRFDPAPYRVGKWLSLASMAFFVVMLAREWRQKRQKGRV